MAATKFLIDDRQSDDEVSPAGAGSAERSPLVGGVARVARWLSWVEWVVVIPTQIYAAIGWLAIPVLLVLAAPLVVFAVFLAVQAPVFFVLWKLFGTPELPAAELPGGELPRSWESTST
jgi:hypothetical protein